MMKKISTIVFAGVLSTQAFAYGVVSNVHVIQVRVDGDGRGMLVFDQPLSGAVAACGQDSSYKNAMAFNATTGKGLLALGLSAKATGTTIDVYGTGSCGVYGDYVEDIGYAVNH